MKRGPKGVLLALSLVAVAGVGCDEGDTITNTPPTLSATCTASPTAGAAPLEVAFALGVAGAQGSVSVSVNYGDGTTGADPDATHTYTAGGLYTASFTVTTPSQSARCATAVEVAAGTSGGGTDPGDGANADGNLPPIADFRANPSGKNGKISGAAPFPVTFNMCLTADPEGDTLYFTMDLDGDGKLDVRGSTGASCRETWSFAAGTWRPEICVTDLGPEGERLHPFECQKFRVEAS